MCVGHCLNLTTYVTYPPDLPVAGLVQSALLSRPMPLLPCRRGFSRTTWLQGRKSTCQQKYCPQTRCARLWPQARQTLFLLVRPACLSTIRKNTQHPTRLRSPRLTMVWSSSQSLWVALWLYSAAVRFPLRSSVPFRQMRRTGLHTLCFLCRLCLASASSVLTHRTQWSASSPPSSKRVCQPHASPSATPTRPLPQV